MLSSQRHYQCDDEGNGVDNHDGGGSDNSKHFCILIIVALAFIVAVSFVVVVVVINTVFTTVLYLHEGLFMNVSLLMFVFSVHCHVH